jgi:wyosine [tRNA(Phe)-imidazoG37] synthetase (radical SAM superfamily)
MSQQPKASQPLHRDHRRQWRSCLYVYPVISRRARGLSIGVNLNPDMRCTFACAYCQIDRRRPRGLVGVDLPVLRRELDLALAEAASGRLWQSPPLDATPPAMRRINDIAFSGDGEPTCVETFDQAVRVAADAKAAAGLSDVKLVVITNAAHLLSPQVQRALPILDASGGEIWAKLDAGDESRFHAINRPAPGVTLAGVVEGIISVARGRPVVIQTLMARVGGQGPSDQDVEAYCQCLNNMLAAGAQIKCVQLHTLARQPHGGIAIAALADAELDALAERIRHAAPGAPVETFYGSPTPPPPG